MTKRKIGNFVAHQAEGSEGLGEGDLTERKDNPHLLEEAKFLKEIGTTVLNLLRKRFVLGRSTMDRRRDVTIAQRQIVVPTIRFRPIRKAGLMEGRKKPLPAPISREHPSSPRATVSSGCKADDKKSRLGIAKTR